MAEEPSKVEKAENPQEITATERCFGETRTFNLSPYARAILTAKSPEELRDIPSPRVEHHALLESIKKNMSVLEKKLNAYSGDHWFEDPLYRLYSGSFEGYRIQGGTQDIVETLRSASPFPGQTISASFQKIYEQGVGLEWKQSDNEQWDERAMPMVTAFLHARTFLELTVKYGKELEIAPAMMPSGWAAVLCFYNKL